MSAPTSATADDERPPTRALSTLECWERLSSAPYGRIAAAAGGEIDIFPVNHRVDDRTIVFRTAAGTKLIELTIHRDVVFEIDGYDHSLAYSVIVKGAAIELQTNAEIERAAHAGPEPWAPEEKDRWVRIIPRIVSGREFQRR